MAGKLFLIDGHALIFKMYYAFLGRPMVNSKGVDTSILFGFTKYLFELVEKEHPTHLAVSFDPPGGTFRNRLYPAYKANRSETPQLVIDALEPLTSIVSAMDIPVLMIPDYEADDVIGSAARRFSAEGMDVYMVTPDKDYGQLVSEHVFQYRPGKSGENETLGINEICAKWNIRTPQQVIDILTLCGDSSDNVPGVDGVGPVGAAKLLERYGSVENIYAHAAELSPKMQERFRNAEGHIALSKELVTIRTDIELDVAASDLEFVISDKARVAALFGLYEFNSLKRHLDSMPGPAAAGTPAPQAPAISVGTVGAADLLGEKSVALLYDGGSLWAASCREGTCAAACGSPEDFRSLLEDPDVEKYGSGLKELTRALRKEGICLKGKLLDISIMHYLLNPERSHDIQSLASGYLGIDLDAAGPAQPAVGSLFDGDGGEDRNDMPLRVFVTGMLGRKLREELSTAGMSGLYDDIEEPLIGVLARMEDAGVKVDVESLRGFADSLRAEAAAHEARVRELSGEPALNVASPKQVGEVLFGKMKLDPKAKKPAKGNWPTDEETLLELADRSPIIDEILQYRGTRKLLSTYIEPFPGYISLSDGRVHTTFNQALTSTGRLSSSGPNLQNIPVRTEQGRRIREAFVAGSPDAVMMSADYSQIELRVMAHLSCDPHLIAAFRDGLDIHAATAAKIFNVPVEDVTPEQRRMAKTANFGIMYGISAFGLSQRLRCSRSEARKLIDDYFESFQSIRTFIDDTLTAARETGYVETIFGRRRYIPEINSHNANIRAVAERNAVNAPIQGTAADIIKMAMVGVDRQLRERRLRSRMVLQIHDELLLEVPAEEIDTVKDILISEMEGVVRLSIPLTVECSYGKTWLEAH